MNKTLWQETKEIQFMGEITDIGSIRQLSGKEGKSDPSRPDALCARCKKSFFLDELSPLPEFEAYIRQQASSMLRNAPAPKPVDETALIHRYGFGLKALFCEDCLHKIIQAAK